MKKNYKVIIEGLVHDQFCMLGNTGVEVINKVKSQYNRVNAFMVEDTIYIEVLDV